MIAGEFCYLDYFRQLIIFLHIRAAQHKMLNKNVFFSEINCPNPGNGVGVDRVDGGNWTFGSEVYYLCPFGYIDSYTRLQSIVIECFANKTWSMPAPVCVRTYRFLIVLLLYYRLRSFMLRERQRLVINTKICIECTKYLCKFGLSSKNLLAFEQQFVFI